MSEEYKPYVPKKGEKKVVHIAIPQAGTKPETKEGNIRYIPARTKGIEVRRETYEVKVDKMFRDDPRFDLKLDNVADEEGNYLILHLHKEDIFVER